MLNNLTNFFNLIVGRRVKTTASPDDLVTLGVRDPRTPGIYQPAAIKVSDLVPPAGVTAVTGTSPVVSSGGSTPAISIPAATNSVDGYLTAADRTTFNNKVSSVTGTAPIASSGGATPAISIATASAGSSGALSSTDWSAFNSKQTALVSGTNIKTVNSTSLLGSGDVAVQPTLVSGTNIKTVNSTTLLGSGDIAVQPTLVSGTNIKTINSNSLLGSGNLVLASGRPRQSLAASTGITQYSAGSGSAFGIAWAPTPLITATGQIIDIDFSVRNPSGNAVQLAIYVNTTNTLTGATLVCAFDNPLFDYVARLFRRYIVCQDGTNIRLMGAQTVSASQLTDVGARLPMANSAATLAPLIGNTTTGVTSQNLIFAISFNGSLIAASVEY
jgi:hypothetical protein